MTDIRTASDPFLAAQPTVLRRVGPPEAPWPAAVVRHGAGPALMVDAALLPAGVYGPAAEHCARAMEVVRTDGGQAVLLPCLDRRIVPAMFAAPGAAVTLAVSLLRGIVEAAEHDGAIGEWWLAEEGRPLFVPVAGGEPAAVGAAALLRESGESGGLAVLTELAGALAELETRDLERWETRLFSLHAPAPIVDASMPAPAVSTRRELRHPRRRVRSASTHRGAFATIDEALVAMISDVGSAVWRAARRVRLRRKPALMATAGAVVLVVLGVGLTWPAGADEGMASVQPSTTAVVAATDDAQSDDPVDAAGRLLAVLRGCGDAACRGTVMEDASTPLPAAGAALAPAPTLGLIDDLGGLAVVGATDGSGSSPSQIVLLVARDGKWLIRDVYDAADQP